MNTEPKTNESTTELQGGITKAKKRGNYIAIAAGIWATYLFPALMGYMLIQQESEVFIVGGFILLTLFYMEGGRYLIAYGEGK